MEVFCLLLSWKWIFGQIEQNDSLIYEILLTKKSCILVDLFSFLLDLKHHNNLDEAVSNYYIEQTIHQILYNSK